MFINTNLWMDIYGCIFMRGLKTGYRDQNSYTDVADAITRSIADCITDFLKKNKGYDIVKPRSYS